MKKPETFLSLLLTSSKIHLLERSWRINRKALKTITP